jgi:terminase, large subunit
VMDSFSEVGVNKVVFVKCARIGATEAGLNIVGFFIHQDPSAIMIVQPTVDDAKDFSKEQLAPTISDTPVLAERVASGVKESSNTITSKTYPGGSLVMGGANSPRFFRRRTIRVAIGEELSGWGSSKSAKGEGDQLKLMEKRTETMGYRRKIYLNSTPTVKGECRITEEWDKSDQRHYLVPCPHCQHKQRLVWERLLYKEREAPAYQCVACEALIEESDKDVMVARGEWVVTRPLKSTRGYHLNALYSPFVRWTRLVEEWEDAQGDTEALQVFVNTALGEAWEDRETETLIDALKARSLAYGPEDAQWRVPRGACALYCGVDKQPSELRASVYAVGPDEQMWLIDRVRFGGDTSSGVVWGEFDQWRLSKTWLHEGGARMTLRAVCIDSGDDPDPVYLYTKPRLAEHVYAIKGATDPLAPILPIKPTRTRLRSRLYVIGTQVIKKRIYRRLAMPAPAEYTLDVGRQFMHFNDLANGQYWSEIFSATLQRIEYRGRSVSIYVKRRDARDEELDCLVYAYAALQLGPVPLTALHEEWERIIQEGAMVDKPVETTQEKEPARESWLGPARERGSWMRRGRS